MTGCVARHPNESGVRIETIATTHLRLMVRGFLRLRATLNEIASEMETATIQPMTAH
jgi:hypothetical protein